MESSTKHSLGVYHPAEYVGIMQGKYILAPIFLISSYPLIQCVIEEGKASDEILRREYII